MAAKSKPATQIMRMPLTEAEIDKLNEHISAHEVTVQWFSVVHQEMFSLEVNSYEQASKLVSTLDFGRVCNIRIVDDCHRVIHSFH